MRNSLFLLLFLFSVTAFSQIAFNTGSAQLDADLNVINNNGSADFVSFRQELSLSFNVPIKKIDYMRTQLNLIPGEIFLSLELGRISRRPVDEVVEVYRANRGKGWGNIAKQLGVKPGSPEFHQLKNSASSNKNKQKQKPAKSIAKANKKKH